MGKKTKSAKSVSQKVCTRFLISPLFSHSETILVIRNYVAVSSFACLSLKTTILVWCRSTLDGMTCNNKKDGVHRRLQLRDQCARTELTFSVEEPQVAWRDYIDYKNTAIMK